MPVPGAAGGAPALQQARQAEGRYRPVRARANAWRTFGRVRRTSRIVMTARAMLSAPMAIDAQPSRLPVLMLAPGATSAA